MGIKILIIGDSFAADWSLKYDNYKGWPNLLAQEYDVTNLAQAGVSEYKIYKQLTNINIDNFDTLIVSHTSPYRVPTRKHPIHAEDKLHNSSDLIIADIEYHSSRYKNILNSSLRSAKNFFDHHFDEDFFYTTHMLYKKEIMNLTESKNTIHLDWFDNVSEFRKLWENFSGKINHFSEEGNMLVYRMIQTRLN